MSQNKTDETAERCYAEEDGKHWADVDGTCCSCGLDRPKGTPMSLAFRITYGDK